MAKTARRQTKKKAERLEANRDRVAKGLSVRRGQDRIPFRLVLLLCFVCVVVCLFVFWLLPSFCFLVAFS